MNPLRDKIGREMRDRGPIPFSRYMELCLYDREFGYYARNAAQFGKAGDFYTSSDVHAVFGRLMARQFDEMWRVLGRPESISVTELGPGRGLFAQDVLDWSEKKFPDFFRALRYVLVESSPALQQRMKEILARHLGAGKAVLTGESVTPEAADTPTIIFANEFFDALPVEIVSRRWLVASGSAPWSIRRTLGSAFSRRDGISRSLQRSSRSRRSSGGWPCRAAICESRAG